MSFQVKLFVGNKITGITGQGFAFMVSFFVLLKASRVFANISTLIAWIGHTVMLGLVVVFKQVLPPRGVVTQFTGKPSRLGMISLNNGNMKLSLRSLGKKIIM